MDTRGTILMPRSVAHPLKCRRQELFEVGTMHVVTFSEIVLKGVMLIMDQ